jgi:hypothetical protein
MRDDPHPGGKGRGRIRKRWTVLALVTVLLGYLSFDFLVVDDCYDDGGVWRWSEFACKGRR